MTKRFVALLIMICMVLGLTGCNFSIRDTVEAKDTTLPPLRIDSTLICAIESMDGNRCTLTVLEDNGTYDKDDQVIVTYETVKKNAKLHNGDVITFTYNYVTDVSAIGDTPHIMIETIAIIDNSIPPETTVENTEETVN